MRHQGVSGRGLDGPCFLASPFRVVGVGFEEPHLRLMFWLAEPGFHEFPVVLDIYICIVHQGGLVLR